MKSPSREVDEIDLEENRRAMVELFEELGGVVLTLDGVEDDV